MEKVKQYSVNCQGCGKEFVNFQIRPAKLGQKVLDLCVTCQKKTDIYQDYREAAAILSDIYKEAGASGPSVIVEPVEPIVQKAVDLLKRMDSSYFDGVSKILIGQSGQYGHVESGKDKDPTVINLNFQRIKNEAKNDPRTAILNTAITIAHERAHVKSFNDKAGFVGGESVAETEERKVEQWIKNNLSSIENLLT